MSLHKMYMHKCIELAKKGKHTSPNPKVGCVLVKGGKVIAQAYHKKYGQYHAERLALQKAGKKAKGATLYVNLEPCTHHGKTPPCTDSIIQSGVKHVVYASSDPNPKVRAESVLRKAKIRVTKHVLKQQADLLNEQFLFAIKQKQPFVTLKVAMTLDGKIAKNNKKEISISSQQSKRDVHVLRTQHDAVAVGIGTVLADNPKLNPRLAKGNDPMKIVFDSRLRIPLSCNLVKKPKKLIVCTALKKKNAKYRALEKKGVTVIQCKTKNKNIAIKDALKKIYKQNINSILLEGGAQLYSSFLKEKAVNKYVSYIAPALMGSGYSAFESLPKLYKLRDVFVSPSGPDIKIEGYV